MFPRKLFYELFRGRSVGVVKRPDFRQGCFKNLTKKRSLPLVNEHFLLNF